jgi:hypothetical protein
VAQYKKSMRHILLYLFLCLSSKLYSQVTPIAITKINEPINFDGIVNESVWNNASLFPFYRQSPDYGKEPSEKTELRIIYDNKFLYVGAKLFQKDITKIQDYSKQRDGGGPMDYITIVLDGYNDKTNGLVFATTPAGLRWDGTVTFDSKGLSLTSDWNTYWEVKTSKDENGWYAEFRIPLSSLRFNSNSEEVIMNLVLYRKIASNNEFSVFPNIPPNWGLLSFANIAQGHPIKFKGIKNNNPVYFTPYALAGLSNNKILNTTNTNYISSKTSLFQAGLDIKYSLSSKLTLDATINTDFAQIEADNLQVNLSRSSLFFSEKREFFLERTNNFSFAFDQNNDVFYSRKIGLENGQISKIYAGARLVARVNKWDIGALNMQTQDLANDASKNIGLVRLKKQIGNNNNYVGAIFTSSIGKNQHQYFTTGFDAQFALPLKSYFKISTASSAVNSYFNELLNSSNARLNAKIEMPSQRGFYYLLNHSIVGTNYNPAIGFEERHNIKNYSAAIGYIALPKASRQIFKHKFLIDGYLINRFSDNKKESVGVGASYSMELKNGTSVGIKPYIREEVLYNPLVLSTTFSIPAGTYSFNGIKLNFNTPTATKVASNIGIDIGSFYNATILSINPQISFNGSKLLQVQANYRYDKVYDSKYLNTFVNQIFSLSTILTFTTKLSIASLSQYDYINKKVSSNIRLRYNTKEGNDLFFVATNINNTDRYREIPTLPSIQSWLFLVKYKYTFSLTTSKK